MKIKTSGYKVLANAWLLASHIKWGYSKFFALVILLLLNGMLFAQYRNIDTVVQGDKNLRNIRLGFVINLLSTGNKDHWASSYLPAEGKPPVKPEFEKDIEAMDDEHLDEEIQKRETYNAWARMYGAGEVQDGNVNTAWVEGVSGNGEGEVLIVELNPLNSLIINAGYQKSQEIFYKNARPRKVRVWVLEASDIRASQFDTYIYEIKAIAYREVELKDVFGSQPLPTPTDWKPGTMKQVIGIEPDGTETVSIVDAPRFVAIQILSIYPGTKYQDCCISEITEL